MRLVIETAGPACSVALFDHDMCVAAIHEEVGRGHAERLIPMIASLPHGGRADTVLVDCGPGSFTGVRVGLSAAQGLGLGWGVPVAGYSSLALLAACHFDTNSDDSVTITIPGGHGEVFVQRFMRAPFVEATALSSLPPNAVVADDRINFAIAPLDARHISRLPPAFTTLPPKPLYGRGADAKPVLSGVEGPVP
jgi:tRNA threonylcarbamoyladenosine biosynthesis protein TsaB